MHANLIFGLKFRGKPGSMQKNLFFSSPDRAAARGGGGRGGDLAARYRCSLILEQFITHRPEIMWYTVARGIYTSASVGIIRLKAAENGLIELDRGDIGARCNFFSALTK
jgi:hypothetical protein